jgi:hypothetical protein
MSTSTGIGLGAFGFAIRTSFSPFTIGISPGDYFFENVSCVNQIGSGRHPAGGVSDGGRLVVYLKDCVVLSWDGLLAQVPRVDSQSQLTCY